MPDLWRPEAGIVRQEFYSFSCAEQIHSAFGGALRRLTVYGQFS
jgi:hypothetical protein